jgi:hypothetical protein
MSRRSSRRVEAAASTTTASLPPNIERGLASLVEGNARLISSMLSIDLKKSKKTDEDGNDNNENDNNTQLLVSALSDCIRINDLSIEAFLTRFFDKSVLSKYCINKLAKNYNVSGKGNEATLAARIGKIWSKPDFELKEIEIEEETAAAVDDVAATKTTTKKAAVVVAVSSSDGTKMKRQKKDAGDDADKVKSNKKPKKGGSKKNDGC